MFEINPKEAIGFPGYYEIPGYGRYVLSRDGVVLNKLTGSPMWGGTNPDGYVNFGLTSDLGHRFTWGRHRLMGFVFKHPGVDTTDLVVNHRNGIKGDDRLSNLEWGTYQYNAEHAGMMGLTEKCLPISVRDVDTGEVTKYPSIIECARVSGFTKDAINYRIKAGEQRVFPERKQYRNSHSNEPWYEPTDIEGELMNNTTSKKVVMRCVLSGETKVFDQLGQLANHLSVSPSTITQYLLQENQPVLPSLIQLKRANDPATWRFVKDPYIELNRYTGKRSVKTISSKTGEIKIFQSAVECAEEMGLSPTSLNYRLKSKGNVVFPDGFSYIYYSDALGLHG